MTKIIKAALVVIGDEITHGDRQDTHAQWFANALNEKGIDLTEVRLIADDKSKIAKTVKELSEEYDYVFTTGGLGPTAGDKTAESIAAGFGVKLVKNQEAFEILRKHYEKVGRDFTEARQKPAHLPEGATVIANPAGSSPGFCINGNVYAMPGPPAEAQPMFNQNIAPHLRTGTKTEKKIIFHDILEALYAKEMKDVMKQFPNVEISSAHMKNDPVKPLKAGRIVMRSKDKEQLELAYEEVKKN